MQTRITGLLILVFLLFFGSLGAEAQIKLPPIFNNKNESQGSQKESKYNARDSAELLIPAFTFKNINFVPYYYREKDLDQVRKYHKDGDIQNLYKSLSAYIEHFGIENFILDNDLLWLLARSADSLGKNDFAQQMYRLALRHHRKGQKIPSLIYERVMDIEKRKTQLTADAFFELIERWQLSDSLQPAKDSERNLGDSINSPYEDYGLTISFSDSLLLFTSKRPAYDTAANPHLKIKELKFNENIYIARKIGENKWSAAQPFEAINTSYNEGSPSLRKDGKMIAFARCHAPGGYGNCDIYITEWNDKKQKWDTPYNLGAGVNDYSWDSHPTFSITGDTLFFASDRKGGFGGTDIYYTEKNKQGRWSKARNIGPIINTQHNELSPFLHPSKGILYFSSDGHLVNFGSFDIFKSYCIDKGRWSEPKNLGPFVNTEGSEFYFTIDANHEYIFYARERIKSKEAERKTFENTDLYMFKLPIELQAETLVKLSGRVIEELTGEVFEGIVAVFDTESKMPIAPKHINADGTFEFELPPHREYLVIVSGENFFRIEELFYLGEEAAEIEIPVRKVERIRFESVEFERGKAQILPKMENDLHLVITFLQENENFDLLIEGHTDTSGNADANKNLSQDRADAIKTYILSYSDIAEARVKAIGKGSEEPIIAEEKSEEDRKLNRRVEFKIQRKEVIE
ncbi:MAG: OmpA family protein [Bernardetiaceae bacterium]|nr:OmpA family protein [Bernardetiaceae bacterium]